MHIKHVAIVCFLFFSFSALNAQELRKIKVTDLEQIITESKTPLIVNFWATFCKPCIAEIPYFEEEVKKQVKDSVQLLLVSLDMDDHYPDRIRKFAARQKFTSPILWLDETNADYFCPKVDPKWSGSIPSSLFINNRTGYRKFFEDELTHEELRKEIAALLGK